MIHDPLFTPAPVPVQGVLARMSFSKKTMALAAAGLVLAGAAVWWTVDYFAVDPMAGVLTAEVTKADMELAVLATGTLRPVRLVAVGAQVSGRLTAMKVTVGQSVKTGDLIAEIDSITQQNALKTAEAALNSVRAQLEEKQANLTYALAALARENITLAQKATSRDANEAAQMSVKISRFQIAALEAQIIEAQVAVATTKVNLGYTKITAPLDGTVLLVVSQEGQTVNAAQSAPTIVILGQVDRMTVRAEISEADVTRVKAGQPVYFTILGDLENRWEASLASIDPAPDTIRADTSIATTSSSASSSSSSTSSAIYYYGRFDVPNADGRLKTYMTAQVHVVLGAAKGVLTIPASALSPAGPKGERSVDVVDGDNNITSRMVEIGLNDKVRVEIRTGLKLGERVVSNRKAVVTGAKPAMRGPQMGL